MDSTEVVPKEEVPGRPADSSSLLESMLMGETPQPSQQSFVIKTEPELKMPSWIGLLADSPAGKLAGTVKRGANGRPIKPDLSTALRKNAAGLKLKHPTPMFARAAAANRGGFKKESPDPSWGSPPSVGSSSQETDQCNDGNSVSDRMVDELEVEETWPGKVCAFCNLGERSQLGQGEMLRLEVSADFETMRQNHCAERSQVVTPVTSASLVKQPGLIKKPRLTGKGRRSSSFDASNSCLSEQQLELNMVRTPITSYLQA